MQTIDVVNEFLWKIFQQLKVTEKNTIALGISTRWETKKVTS